MEKKKVVFMGTPMFAVNVLEKLNEVCDVTLVVTQPDKEVGRKRILTPSPVKAFALEHNIPVFQPTKIRVDYERILEEQPDLIVTCAYGQIIPKVLLDLPKYGCINVHASLLPKLRGGAPIHHAILDGYSKTGVTIMYMNEGMDQGNIISQRELEIHETDTMGYLFDELSKIGSKLLIDTLPSIFEGTNASIPQKEEEVTYGYVVKREEEQILTSMSVSYVDRLVRALNPSPCANLVIDGEEYKIISGYPSKCVSNPGTLEISKKEFGIHVSDGIYYVTRLKPFGKKEMDVVSFLNGINKEEWKTKRV